jgi:hypothetical protein
MPRKRGSTTLTNITPDHRRAFNRLTGAHAGNFALFSCFVNGEPTSAIVAISRHERKGDFIISPVFVAVTPAMALTDHDGTPVAPMEAV